MKNYKKNEIDILLVTDNGLETVGGEQESVKIILNGVNDKFKLGVIQPGKVTRPIPNVNYYDLTKKTRIKHLIKNPFKFLSYIVKVRKIIKKAHPKVLHTQAQVSFFFTALMKKLKLIPKDIKLIHTERGLYIRYNSFFKALFNFCMKELDVLITTTHFNKRYWIEAHKQKKKINLEYRVIENTAGELFETYDLAKEKNVDSNKLTIGFAGRYSKQKNWPLAVEICKKLNEQLQDKLYVNMAVGCLDEKSTIETEKMFNELRDILGSRFNGMINIDIEAMNDFYYSLDVYILTSLPNSESFGRTIVEAMSRKTVVLSTNAGGPVEVLDNNNNICNTSNEFVKNILDFYDNKEKMYIEKENNVKKVRERFSLNNHIDKYVKLYTVVTEKSDHINILEESS